MGEKREAAMVRRAAEAMYEGFRQSVIDSLGSDWASIPWAELDGASKRHYCAAARAAIEDMREPHEAVIAAVENKAEERYNAAPDMLRWYGEDVWAAGIDAALAVPEEGKTP